MLIKSGKFPFERQIGNYFDLSYINVEACHLKF